MNNEIIATAHQKLDELILKGKSFVICAITETSEVKAHFHASPVELVFITKTLDLLCSRMLTQVKHEVDDSVR